MEASPVRQQLHGLAYNALLYLFKYISTMLPPVFVWRIADCLSEADKGTLLDGAVAAAEYLE